MPTYSEQICTHFNGCKFSTEFKNDIDEFFKNSKNLTHLQYFAVSEKLNNKNILDEFKNQIDEIWNNSQNLLIKFVIKSISDMIYFLNSENLEFKNIKFASGETHNGKKSVLIFEINKNKFVYKPYSCSYLPVLNESFNILKVNLKYELEIFPKILMQNDSFTIVKFIKTQNEINLEKAYYAIGVVLGFATAFRITDLHSENILFNNDNLYILDSESCFFRDNFNNKFSPKFTHLIDGAFCDNSNLEYNLHFADENQVEFLKNRNYIKPNLDLLKNIDYIKNGYDDIMYQITQNSKRLIDVILSYNFCTRIILRPTNAYTVWLSELFKPNKNFKINVAYLYSEISNISKINLNTEKLNSIIKAELMDLISTDIPYFSICKNSLYHNDKIILSNIYKINFEKFIKELFINLKFDDNIIKKNLNLSIFALTYLDSFYKNSTPFYKNSYCKQ